MPGLSGTALELQDAVAPAEGAGKAHRIEIGLRAAADEAHLLGAGHGLHDGGGEPDAQRVVREEGRALRQLRRDRRRHLGMRMAHEHRPGAQQVVDVAVAADVPDMPAAPLGDHDVRGHVAKMPRRQHAAGQGGELELIGAARGHRAVSSAGVSRMRRSAAASIAARL
jgi:hypothetical protein